MRVDALTLMKCGLHPTQAKRWAPHVEPACARFEINTAPRLAAWVGQIRVESRDFTVLEEGLSYTTSKRLMEVWPSRLPTIESTIPYLRNPQALANFVYAGRNGNGDVASGDGWRYRGSGLKQLTGRGNFLAAERALGRPYVAQPELVRQEADAALTAAHFFSANGCLPLADAWNLDAITRAVNGRGMLQAKERAEFSEQAMRELRRDF